jgi:putative ABC transport system permease protein
MGMHLLRGREFNEHDTASSLSVVIVSRTVAKTIDPLEDVIGKQVSLWTSAKPEIWHTVVGVVDDLKQLGPSQKSYAVIYQPYPQVSQRFFLSHMTYVVRTGSDPLAAVPAMRSVLRAVDKDQPATAIGLLNDSLDRATAEPAFYARLLGAFALLAVTLALVGTYGVIAYAVAQRNHEIGLRMALGAKPGMVLSMVMRQGFTIVAIGMIAGGLLAAAAATALRGILYGVTPFDPVAWGLALSAMLAAAALANFVPARRAMRIDPMSALRTE